jgi:hypothetical protein
MALCAAVSAACGAPSAPDIAIDSTNPRQTAITVSGLSRDELAALSRANLSREGWTAVLRVSVTREGAPAPLPVTGRYEVRDGGIRFTPLLPLEPGRRYEVAFEPAAVPGARHGDLRTVSRVVELPAPPPAAPTTVVAAYPTGPEVPANLLRMYVEFSGPMGIRTGENYIAVLDGGGKEISGALLPLDTDLWNPDHTRFTVLFDPGRVKRGILPNRAMGRPLKDGQSFTLLVRSDWPDANGRPLASEFRKTYRVGPAIERPLSVAGWRIAAPAGGSRDPLVVTFESSLDHALLQRALRVGRGDELVAGDARVDRGETQWTFVPRDPWQAGAHALTVQPELEDAAGNRIGRAFEARRPAHDRGQNEARLPFVIR